MHRCPSPPPQAPAMDNFLCAGIAAAGAICIMNPVGQTPVGQPCGHVAVDGMVDGWAGEVGLPEPVLAAVELSLPMGHFLGSMACCRGCVPCGVVHLLVMVPKTPCACFHASWYSWMWWVAGQRSGCRFTSSPTHLGAYVNGSGIPSVALRNGTWGWVGRCEDAPAVPRGTRPPVPSRVEQGIPPEQPLQSSQRGEGFGGHPSIPSPAPLPG